MAFGFGSHEWLRDLLTKAAEHARSRGILDVGLDPERSTNALANTGPEPSALKLGSNAEGVTLDLLNNAARARPVRFFPEEDPEDGHVSAASLGSSLGDLTDSRMADTSGRLFAAAPTRQGQFPGAALSSGAGPATAPSGQPPATRPAFTENDVDMLARLIFAEGAGQAAKPGVYLGIGNTVLNRIGKPGFANSLQGVINQRLPNGTRQFDSVGGRLWNQAANPSALTGPNATAYNAARALANDLLYGSEYIFDDPTNDSTYFYSSGTRLPPRGFFTTAERSGRLRREYDAGDFFFLRDTRQPR